MSSMRVAKEHTGVIARQSQNQVVNVSTTGHGLNTLVPPIVATLITTVLIGAAWWIPTVKGKLGDTVRLPAWPFPRRPRPGQPQLQALGGERRRVAHVGNLVTLSHF